MTSDFDSPSRETTRLAASTTIDQGTLEDTVCRFESITYHPDANVYRAIFNADSVSPSTAVIGALSAVSDRDPLEIQPQYPTIDPDAFDSLVSPDVGSEGDVHVTFTLEGYEFTVSSYGKIRIRGNRDDEPPTPNED